ncbi:MAG: DUF945 family protein [Desulfuromusa sp.]|jgi:uncharacterized protein YdgA (DUF945 family)|nr:DUF945 family protein [Desulfuromusa sp.]
MKKILSSLMALIIITLFVLTWYSSRKTEQLFTAQIKTFNQAAAEQIEIELQNYQRSLFSSSARTSLRVQGQEEVTFDHQIRHFVWGIKMVTTLAKDSDLARVIAEKTPLEQFQLKTDINFRGASQSKLELPAISLQEANGNLKITGLRAGWDLNADLTMGEMTGQADNLLLQAEQLEMNLSGLAFTSQMTDLQDIPLGNGELQLEKFQLMDHGKPAIEFHNIQYQGQTELEQDIFSSTAALSFSTAFLAEEKLSNGRLQLVLSGIDSEMLHSLQQTAKQLQNKALNQQSSSLELQLQLFELYTQLMQSGVSLNLEKLSLDTENGSINGKGTLALLNSTSAARSLFSLENIKADFQLDIDQGAFVTGYLLLNNLKSSGGNKQNSAVLAEQAEQIAGALVQKGIFIRQDGDKFHVEYSLSEGQGKLNGEPF